MGRNAPREQGNIWQEIRRDLVSCPETVRGIGNNRLRRKEVVISGLQFVEICSKSLEKGLEKW